MNLHQNMTFLVSLLLRGVSFFVKKKRKGNRLLNSNRDYYSSCNFFFNRTKDTLKKKSP